MNLKQKLAIRSTLVCAFTLLLVFGSTLYIYQKQTINYFYNKLEGRALLSAIIYLEKDELNKQKYHEYESRYLNRVDKEVVQIYDANDQVAFVPEISSFPVEKSTLNRIRRKGKENFLVNGKQYTGLYYEDNQGNFVIITTGEDNSGRTRLQNLALVLVCLFVVGVLVNYILNVLLARKTFKPFSSILRKVNTISTENLNSRLEQVNQPGDELSELIKTLNTFLDRLELGVNTQKQFSKNVSHELKTPLAAIIGEAELSLHKERSQEEYRVVLQKILKSTIDINSVIEGLLLISGLKQTDSRAHFRNFRLDELLWEVLERLKIKYPEAEVDTLLEVEDADLLELHLHPELVSTAITNIIDNALKFSEDQKVKLVLRELDRNRLALLVQDTGPGIPEQEQEKVFDLFFRGSNTQYYKPGHGVGLSLTKHIAEFCQIEISLSSITGQGTEVKLVFPPSVVDLMQN
ncbi:HAMP domain-containing sensor histidine kinase [Pontibacter sp. 13R65]|uniref:sensor histidine kinase n=1 Tax=Pontibacter sp. 13R65 TaxID=3127458 RepID=UPI00301BDB86